MCYDDNWRREEERGQKVSFAGARRLGGEKVGITSVGSALTRRAWGRWGGIVTWKLDYYVNWVFLTRERF